MGQLNFDDNYNVNINALLEKIERQLAKYEKYPGVTDIQQLIKDRIDGHNSMISSRESLLSDIKEWKIRYKEIQDYVESNHNKVNIYEKEIWPYIISMLLLFANKNEESERQIYRANYCLQSNNQMFRILDSIYNNNFSTSNEANIQENSHVTKINIAMFLINYTFEELLIECKNIILVNLEKLGYNDLKLFNTIDLNDKKLIIDELIKKVSNIQILGDILGELKCFDERGELTNLLKQYDSKFNRRTPSKLRTIRNASSHGEFYPNMEKISNIKLLIDNNGVQRYELTYFDIIGLANEYISMLPNKDNLDIFLQLLHSNNLPITLESLMKLPSSKNKLVESLCVLSLYNIIQYNNEKHFRDNIELKQELKNICKVESDSIKGENYLDSMDLSYYFATSFAFTSSDEILQTIKYSISHINYDFDGEKFIFTNPQDETKSCTCNIGRLLLFIAEDEVYQLSSSTSYYKKIKKISKELIDKYIYGNYYFPDSELVKIDYQEYKNFNNIDNINSKKY